MLGSCFDHFESFDVLMLPSMAQNTATVVMSPDIASIGKEQEALESSHVYVICAGF